MQKLVTGLLKSIVHPETGENIVDGGFVESVTATDEKITVSLLFKKARDPFAIKIKVVTPSREEITDNAFPPKTKNVISIVDSELTQIVTSVLFKYLKGFFIGWFPCWCWCG